MRKRTLHTSINLLIEPGIYQQLKMIATLKEISMSKIIRAAIRLWLDRYEKENNIIQTGENIDHDRSGGKETRA